MIKYDLVLQAINFLSAAIIFTTYFEDLVTLNSDKGYFITDNASMRKFVTSAIKISLNGVSLTVISFTIVFLFHGVGGKYMMVTNVKEQVIKYCVMQRY